MSFDILYVEEDDDDFKDIEEHIHKYNNAEIDRLPINIERARNPLELKDKLDIRHRVVLADIYYDDPDTEESKNCLADIKFIVREWSDKNNLKKIIPIIAYSRRQTQEETLADSNGLFDIWDKITSKPTYVTWRLSKLAQEMSRVQPDYYLQCLIRNMKKGPPWHGMVKEMAKKYNSGWTEYDQINRAGTIITEISQGFKTGTQCTEMWKVMKEWEALGRAISPHTRGHSRHVINVFWLGYYIINHKHMEELYSKFWKKLLLNRGDMEDVGDIPYAEAVNTIWFYAGLFHDVCACIEKNKELTEFQECLYSKFKSIGVNPSIVQQKNISDKIEVEKIIKDITKPLMDELTPLIEKSIKANRPDHGFIGAIFLNKNINSVKQKNYAQEASRAIIIHNLIGDFENINKKLSWENDPFSCLLALCDQLQTWDRERGDEALVQGSDLPVRAELLDLKITKLKNNKLSVMDS